MVSIELDNNSHNHKNGNHTPADTTITIGEEPDGSRSSERSVSDEAYKVTIAAIPKQGAPITKVLDSRKDDIGDSWAGIESSQDSEIICRLVLAEDLPKETEAVLEKVLRGDRRLLDDHMADASWNSHHPSKRRDGKIDSLQRAGPEIK